jgi:hypothetical protein
LYYCRWGSKHSILIVGYNSDDDVKIYDPLPWYYTGGIYTKSKSWLLKEWKEVYGENGEVELGIPKGDYED